MGPFLSSRFSFSLFSFVCNTIMPNGTRDYIPRSLTGAQFSQVHVGLTAFASEKRAATEGTSDEHGSDDDADAVRVGYTMTYPAALPCFHAHPMAIPAPRSDASVFLTTPQAPPPRTAGRRAELPLPSTAGGFLHRPACHGVQANEFWQMPPPVMARAVSCTVDAPVTRSAGGLPRDTMHPLVSELQAAECAKAAGLNPAVALLGNARRDGLPPEAHFSLALGARRGEGGSASAGKDASQQLRGSAEGDGFDPEGGAGPTDDDANLAGNLAASPSGPARQTGGGRMSKRGDVKTAIGRAYSSEGGYHEPDRYSSRMLEFGGSQATTLTAIAAKALCRAIYGPGGQQGAKPLSIPHNAFASRSVPMLPNSTPIGTNANRLHDSNVSASQILPPSLSFRAMHPSVQTVLLERPVDGRNRVAELLRQLHPPTMPPPAAPLCPLHRPDAPPTKPPGGAQDPTAGSPKPAASTTSRFGRSGALAHVPEDERDNPPDGEYEALFKGGTLAAWHYAATRCQATSSLPSTHPTHPAAQLTSGSQRLAVRSASNRVVSLFTSTSGMADFRELLSGTGIRTENTLTQITPPSQSGFYAAAEGRNSAGNGGKGYSGQTAQQRPPVPGSAAKSSQLGPPPLSASAVAASQPQPPNSFGFTPEQFSMLLYGTGMEVREMWLEGATWYNPATLTEIAQNCPNLTMLNLADCVQLTDDVLANIGQRCQGLAFLDVSGCDRVTGKGIGALLRQGGRHLLCLGLSSIGTGIGLDAAFSFLFHAPNLRVLDLSYNDEVDDAVLLHIAQYCVGLEALNLNGCSNVHDRGIASIGCSNAALRKLRMQLCSQVTPAGFACLGRATRGLQVLDFSGCTSLDSQTLDTIVQRLGGLRSISVAGCSLLNDAAIVSLARHCKRLLSLDLSSCINIGLGSCMELLHEVPTMTQLIVSESVISNAEVAMLASLREKTCCVVRNQYRPSIKKPLIAFRLGPPTPVVAAGAKGKPDPKKKK